MRPVRLELEGFATFRQRTELDFDGLDLVAFTGPTGAGKSTLIDAVTFALYGSVSRYDNANVVAPVIHQLANEAKVRFDFEVANRPHTVTRVVRRRSGGVKTEARLERDDPERGGEVLAGTVRDVDTAVIELLGLDFTQFTRTVVLPQGDFAQFLKDEPASRQRLLRRLLDLEVYARMGTVAREEAKQAAQRGEALAQELQRLPEVAEHEIEQLQSRIATLKDLKRSARTWRDELAAIDSSLDPVRSQVKAIDQSLALLAAVAVPAGLTEAEQALTAATDELDHATKALSEARDRRDEWEQRVTDLPDRAALLAAITGAEQLVSVGTRLDELMADSAGRKDRRQDAAAALAAATEVAEAAGKARSTARLAADAGSWRAALAVGEPCPVCLRTVDSVPDHDADAELAEAEAESTSAARSLAMAERELARLDGELAATDQEQRRLEAERTRLEADHGEADGAALARRLAEVDQVEAERRAAAQTMKSAEEAAGRARRQMEGLGEDLTTRARELSRCRDRLASLDPPESNQDSLIENWQGLVDWAASTHDELSTRRANLAAEGKGLVEQRTLVVDGVKAATGELGLPPDPTTLVENVAVAEAETRAELERAENRAKERLRLTDRVAELGAERELNATLGRHLSATGFEAWLLNEALDDIVARATVWLLELSGRQYSLAVDDREFAIVDHNNADQRRDVRTLSGGETFLASLALALALADSIAELAPVDAPRLESMFLDEGFGTLDPATLDVVASAIEELAATGRMIGIVTHVRDLAERMPARFEVTKSPTGSVVELVTA